MKSPDAIGGTDAQQQEYAAKVRTIRADQLGDAHMGRLVSLAGHPPRRLVDAFALHIQTPGRDDKHVAILVWGDRTDSAVALGTEITIHPEP